MKNLSLGSKIAVGFVVVLVLTIVVGLAGYLALGNVVAKTVLYQETNAAKSIFADSREQIGLYFLNSFNEGRSKQEEARRHTVEGLEKCGQTLTDIQNNKALSTDTGEQLGIVLGHLTEYKDAFEGHCGG